MDFNPNLDSEAQFAHAVFGALFVCMPTALWGLHPWWNFCYGYPRLVGSFTGLVWATVKEGRWDVFMEDTFTRGNGFRDFWYYCVGIAVSNFILWL